MKKRDLEEAVELIIWRTVDDVSGDDPQQAAKAIIAKLAEIGAVRVDVEDHPEAGTK